MSPSVRVASLLALVMVLGTLSLASAKHVQDDVVILAGDETVAAPDHVTIISDDGFVPVSDDDRGWLGIHIQDLNRELAEALDLDEEGVLVNDVGEDSPAAENGIEPEDLIISVDGERVRDVDELTEIMDGTRPGQTVTLEVIHDGERRTVDVVLGDEPPGLGSWAPGPGLARGLAALGVRPRLGVEVQPLDEDLASYFGVDEGEGVLVTRVSKNSAADEAGMKSGDVILEVEGETVDSPESLREALREAGEGETKIRLRRKGKEEEVTVELESGGPFVSPRVRRFDIRPDTRRELREQLRRFQHDFRDGRRELRGDLEDTLRELREQIEDLKDELRDLKRDLDDRD